MNDVLESNLENLKKAYQYVFTPIKKWMDIQDIVEMCMKSKDLGLSETQVRFCYAFCKMSVVKEAENYKNYYQL